MLVLLALLLSRGSYAAAQEQGGSCIACHRSIGDERLGKPAKDFGQDIHTAKGFGCVSCHGGDAADPGMSAMDPAKGYIGVPRLEQVVRVCGRCHSDARFMRRYNPSLRVDQVAEYDTSVHGRRLKELSDPNVATCASCHAPHAIRSPSDPKSKVHPLRVAETCGSCHADAERMAPYKITTDQRDQYQASVHWKAMSIEGDLSAPTCNDCHGNHGASPPGISWVGNVCGQCHVHNEELFSKSKHSQVFVQMGIPGCATCHGNHEILATSDSMLGVGEPAVCAGCHAVEDPGGKTAEQMRAIIESLRGRYEEAQTILHKAEHVGMEVSQAQFELSGAKTALVKARAAVHAFRVDAVGAEAEPGLEIAAKARARGIQALEELQFRRKGLAVSVVVILALVAGLLLKIREVERRK